MFDDPVAHYEENVITAYVEYRDKSRDGVAGRSRDLRSALQAGTALFHFREHLPNPGLSRASAEQACSAYGLLGDVVNVAKHKALTSGTPHGPPLVSRAEDIYEEIHFIEYADDQGLYWDKQKGVVVALSDGSTRNLLDVFTDVVNFWETYLVGLGVLPEVREFKCDTAIRHRSRAECEANTLDFEIVRGQRFMQNLRCSRFDPTTGRVVPVKYNQMSFRVYRPRMAVDIAGTHPATGQAFSTSVTLTADESEKCSELSTDDEREAFLRSLPSVQKALSDVASGPPPKG